MMGEIECVVVLVTVSSAAEGRTIAHAVVAEGLAACVNCVGPLQSVYVWEGQVAEEAEYLLVIKTQGQRFPVLEARIRELHSYDVPEIIGLPIAQGSRPYLEWLVAGSQGML